jgi:large subunit ribosomal protein L29
MAKAKAFTLLNDAELVASLDEAKDELLNLRFQLVTGQLDNYSRVNQIKKDVARAKTELRAREIAAAEALEEANG